MYFIHNALSFIRVPWGTAIKLVQYEIKSIFLTYWNHLQCTNNSCNVTWTAVYVLTYKSFYFLLWYFSANEPRLLTKVLVLSIIGQDLRHSFICCLVHINICKRYNDIRVQGAHFNSVPWHFLLLLLGIVLHTSLLSKPTEKLSLTKISCWVWLTSDAIDLIYLDKLSTRHNILRTY